MLTQLSAWLSGSTSRATRRASRRRETTLAVETLERREVFDANPLGDEFAVNTVTTGPQVSGEGRPTAMAMDDAGNYVVVWTSPDSRGTGVFGQRFNADGTKRGEQFQINTNETGNQYGPRVAMDADGDFVVTWYSDSDASSSNFAGSVRRYNNLGEAQGDEFALDASIDRYQRAPAIAMDADGDFVIVSMEPYVDDNNYGIVARRFNSAGEQQGSDIVVNTYNFSSQQNPDVAMDDAGNFVVTWMSTDQDGSSYAVAARRFDAAGVTLDAQDFIVNTTTTGFQGNVSVAMDADGDFIITWEGAGDGDGYGIFAQRFNAAGGRVGGEFVVNAITTTSQTYAAVAMDGAGNFVVTWSTSFSAGTDTDGLSVAAQAFLASGQRLGNEFQANTTTTSYQAASGAALNSAGDLVIVWLAPDGSNGGYFGQRYHLSLNSPPTDVSLSNNTVVTGSATGAVIGVLTGTDPNAGDSLTFTIQNDPDAKFAIVGNELRVNGVLDYETATSHSVTIRVFDGEYSYDKVFTINVTNVPLSPPDDANGATNAVLEGAPVGTVVGLTALAGDGAGAVVYSL
ncbi:MAG TPA: hypothetical protein VGE52_06190, partial [Pirellulales bacterium]